jgi:hypothetical protein
MIAPVFLFTVSYLSYRISERHHAFVPLHKPYLEKLSCIRFLSERSPQYGSMHGPPILSEHSGENLCQRK